MHFIYSNLVYSKLYILILIISFFFFLGKSSFVTCKICFPVFVSTDYFLNENSCSIFCFIKQKKKEKKAPQIVQNSFRIQFYFRFRFYSTFTLLLWLDKFNNNFLSLREIQVSLSYSPSNQRISPPSFMQIKRKLSWPNNFTPSSEAFSIIFISQLTLSNT